MSSFYVTSTKCDDRLFNEKIKYLNLRGNDSASSTNENIRIAVSSFNNTNIVETDRYVCILDGKIFNEKELSLDLTAEKLLISLYDSKKEKMLGDLNGSFSFIIFDKIEKMLFGARDRLGEKPFFYTIANGGIECSSSLRAICKGRHHKINERAKSLYIKFGYIYDSACIFEDVNKLQAGHFFFYNLEKNSIRIEKYWDLDKSFYKNYPTVKDKRGAVEYVRFLLEDAVKIRTEENAKCGIGISSGTDSFYIYNFLRKLGSDFPLFNIIPNETGVCNEYPLALKNIQTVVPEKTINGYIIDDNDFRIGIFDYFSYYDEPNSDFSCPITSLLFRKMRMYDDISIAFSGTAADAIFYGGVLYPRYYGHEKDYLYTYSDIESLCNREIIADDFNDVLANNDKVSMQRYDIKTNLPNLLVKEDIASSHYGIEVRTPFCDYRLSEFLDLLDTDILCYGNDLKYLLKQLIYNRFRINFFGRRKTGFFPDISKIYALDDIKKSIYETLSKDNMQKFFPEIPFKTIEEKLLSYNPSTNNRSLLNLYFYIRMMLDYENNILS